MTIEISGEDAIEALRDVVRDTGPDFVYTRPQGARVCLYAHDGRPSCGVGRALNKLGVSIEVLEKLDRPVYGTAIGSSWTRPILAERGVFLWDIAFEIFREFQSWQDDHEPYRLALAGAEGVWARFVS